MKLCPLCQKRQIEDFEASCISCITVTIIQDMKEIEKTLRGVVEAVRGVENDFIELNSILGRIEDQMNPLLKDD